MSTLVERLNRRHVMSMYAKQSDLYAAMEADREEAAKRIAELESALREARLLCEWIRETPTLHGSINGKAAQIEYTIEQLLKD